MTRETKRPNRLESSAQTAKDMREGGILDDAAYAKITMRHLGRRRSAGRPLTGTDIRALRERAHKSGSIRPIA